ncbi:chromosome segregation protein SMC [Haloferax larsenii]|uniref:Chromosome segregation protein SMC n=1 Tax=Haloferax larsenii TaxID=302484 RepID=A0ABY5R962_HALLR|nr:chromosome segregation protein SMC [Haloferax larsenii]UVE48886.1 chromosome segregation protein SMC [Haloferax larsenii]
MSNRVEELESKVAELQAAVNGLTEELVETKERLRQLEDANDVEIPTRAAQRRGDAEAQSQTQSQSQTQPQSDATDETELVDADAEGGQVDDDEIKTDETEDSDEGETETLGDDIIVA